MRAFGYKQMLTDNNEYRIFERGKTCFLTAASGIFFFHLIPKIGSAMGPSSRLFNNLRDFLLTFAVCQSDREKPLMQSPLVAALN